MNPVRNSATIGGMNPVRNLQLALFVMKEVMNFESGINNFIGIMFLTG